MSSLSVREIGFVLKEIKEQLPLRIEEIWQLEDTLQFRVYSKTIKKKYLLISVDSDLSRIHLCNDRFFISPPSPPPFAMLLRKYLKGSLILDIEQRENDRTVILKYSVPYQLICELSGRHGNIFLIDSENKILGSIRKNRSTLRDLTPGNLYQFPKALPKGELLSKTRFKGENINENVCRYYRDLVERIRFDREKSRVLSVLRKELKREERKLKNIEGDIKRGEKAQILRRYGEILSINFKKIKKGMESIEFIDIYTGEKVKIPLDPALTPKENMEYYFKRAKKLERGREIAQKRKEITEERILELEAFLEEAEKISDMQGLEKLKERLKTFGVTFERSLPHRKKELAHIPYHSFYTSSGKEVLVGKSAKDNEYLTFRVAKGNDFWFHVRGLPGSHVILLLNRGESPTEEDILESALLAAHYSSARGERKVEVTYTQRKYLLPLKGKEGAVRVMKEKTILVDMDYKRLSSILETRH